MMNNHAGPRGEGINLHNTEENAKQKHSKRFLKVTIVVVSLLLVTLSVVVSTRLLLPTRLGWQLMPLKQGNVFSQNVMIWMAGRCYAQKPLIEAVLEAGRLLKKQCPGAGIAYLDASGRNGGKLLGHLSHKHGRDIDICFIGRDLQYRLYPERPQLLTIGYRLSYKKDGRCGTLTFDKKANLCLVLALLKQGTAPVEKIFVEPYIRRWLLDEAKKMNLHTSTMSRLKQVMGYAGRNAAKHNDHLHVRFSR